MGFDSTIRKRIRSLAREEQRSLSEADIYSSPELRTYLENLNVSLMDGDGEISAINVFEGDRDGEIAWTTGYMVNLNWNNRVIWYFPTPEQRFVAFMGLFFHEKAHDLFCDFNEELRAMSYLNQGIIYGEIPSSLSAEEDRDWAEIETALSTPQARSIFVQVFKELSNIVDDVHDENSLIDIYGSFVAEGIYLCQNALHASCPLFEDMCMQLLAGNQSDLSIAYNLLLQTMRFGDVLCRDDSSLVNSRYGAMLEKVRSHAEIACATDDKMRQFSELNYIMLAIWPFIRTELQNQQQQGQQNQQGSAAGQSNSQTQDPGNSQGQAPNAGQNQTGSLTSDQIQQILDQLSQGAAQVGQTRAPEQKHSSKNALQSRSNERKGEKQEKKDSVPKIDAGNAIYAAMKKIQQQVSENKAEQKMEMEAKQTMVDAVFACDQTSSHKGIPLKFERVLSVNQADKDNYDSVMKTLIAVSKRLQRQIVDALRDLKEGYRARHKIAGNELVVNDCYRPDGKCYSNKKNPQDFPDMAISVLVDHSGSMSGERIEAAMKASMLLYDFATGIGIPISISGHRSKSSGGVEYITYTDYERISNNDRYRLSKMEAHGNNRDGMALNIAAGLLERRPEQIKLLIIISDGRPNHTNYGGDAAVKDIQEIIRNCKRKGIEVIAAAIGTDRRQIQEIYEDEFLDISDLTKLPKIMTNIVKKRVLRSAL